MNETNSLFALADALGRLMPLVITGGSILAAALYFKKVAAAEKDRACESRVVVRALFAILDALKKSGCNGPVAACHEELLEMLTDKIKE